MPPNAACYIATWIRGPFGAFFQGPPKPKDPVVFLDDLMISNLLYLCFSVSFRSGDVLEEFFKPHRSKTPASSLLSTQVWCEVS